MAITQLHFSDLKAGRLEDRVVTSLLRFWEARNIKKSGELMSVDFIFLNEKCRRHSKITGKKFTVGLISATPLNATLLFPTAALEHSLDLELEEIHFLDTIPIVLSLVIVILNSSSMGEIVKCIDLVRLQTHTWCEVGSSQGVKREKNNYGFKRRVDVSRYLCAEALLNEEDEDGYSDWEPVQQKMPVEFVKWCCFNCTMANPGNSSAASSTAVGFEEIMLLHSEVYTLEHVNFTSQLLCSYFTADTY
ncbi:hypothetical protein Bca52824_083858 [Brassica carinata]|uniref:Uncharacterized protein n=1 Tax=Brassica carinata TaxID=52824 RepID=A0A8X7PN88_BRACI|nr:hypothetical protein Bca52824_083858 [Brassica carinata]